MYFKLYDYETQEYLTDTKTNLDGIIWEINTIYAYESDFEPIQAETLGEFLLNAHLQLIPVL